MTGSPPTTDSTLKTLIEEHEVFEPCSACGRPVVQLSTHRCPSAGEQHPTTRAERERRAERDGRADDDLVGVFLRASGNTYAYHELDGDGEPRCPTRNPSKAQKFEVVTRREAKSRGKAPCGHCRTVGQDCSGG